MTISGTNSHQLIADELEFNGYAVVPDFLSSEIITGMAEEALAFQMTGQMHHAGTGRGSGLLHNVALRGDEIHWLDGHASSERQDYSDSLELLRLALNRSLSLGLFDYEHHYAVYPVDSHYSRHLDQFQREGRRTLSCILYLNQDWLISDGGALRLYLDAEDFLNFRDVMPVAGTLVIFMSTRFWHEVLPATRTRLSLTGWFSTRAEYPRI